MYRSRAVSLALVGLFVWLTACTTWKEIEISQLADHDRVRVTTMDGECLEVREPLVQTDSIVGHVGEALTAIPLNDVGTVEANQFSGNKTVALVIFTPVLAAAAIYLGVIIACGGYCDD